MRVPVEWLRELVEIAPGVRGRDIAADLVRVGLEEEGIHGGQLRGPLVVGRVLSQVPEPQKNGKTIHWCHVDVGANGQQLTHGIPQEIVCGANNFDAGDWVVCILPGGVLPGNFEISARKTYGHMSNGMICSERELGLGDDHDGIIVLTRYFADRPDILESLEPGMDAIALLGLGREVVEVNVTPDRGYCFSMRGIAREYALATNVDFRDPADIEVPVATGPGFPVRLVDERPIDGRVGCDRYVARTVRDVDASRPSPPWMQRYLTEVGMRPISLAVDVTNYVMMLLGQPLHAFDLDLLPGDIEVRRAAPGEKLTTLDDVERTLAADDLLITGGGEILAIAGVMGGASSEVGPATRNVLIEAAHFDPITVARSSRRHRLATEASKRFERGVDPQIAPVAAELAARLLAEFGGGTIDSTATDVGEPQARSAFDFDVTHPTRLIGLEYPREEVVGTLRRLGCEVTESAGSPIVSVLAPTWRPDLTDGPELVEEVARVRGYDQIPSVVPRAEGRGLTHAQRVRRVVATMLANQGLVEVESYPFIGNGLFDVLGYAADDARRDTVTLANPLQDEAPLMRTSLLDTLLETLRRNVSRGMRDVAVYELGLVTRGSVPKGGAPILPVSSRPDPESEARLYAAVPPQPRHVAFAAAGLAQGSGPWGSSRGFDASDAVTWAREVGEILGIQLQVAAATMAPWHPGRCAAISLPDGRVVGWAGELHPKVLGTLKLPARTVAGELDLDLLTEASLAPISAVKLSTFPLATTDVALTVDETVPVGEVEAALRRGAGPLLESLSLFDLFRGEQVGAGKKSLAFHLAVRAPDRTLTTDEVSAIRDQAVAAAARDCGATQR